MCSYLNMATVGIIGGSGLYQIEGISKVKEVAVKTPFGAPSDKFITGELEGIPVVFLPRHGRGHRISPSEINYRANIYGMKKLGVEAIMSVSACGSLKENISPWILLSLTNF
jgi:5'-methylthioadenosine phosphorylase